MDWAGAAVLKSLVDNQQSVKNKSTTIKTFRPESTATSSKDRWIGTYSIGITILWKLRRPNNNNKKVRNSIKIVIIYTLKMFLSMALKMQDDIVCKTVCGFNGATTFSITTFSIMTFSIMTFSIMTFSIMTLSIKGLLGTQHKRQLA